MSGDRDLEDKIRVKTVVGSVIAAVAASACCLGPVVLSAVGAGALGATAVRLEPLRPLFITATAGLLGAGFYVSYRRTPSQQCAVGGSCAPSAKRSARITLWVAAVIVLLLVTFPYYVNRLV